MVNTGLNTGGHTAELLPRWGSEGSSLTAAVCAEGCSGRSLARRWVFPPTLSSAGMWPVQGQCRAGISWCWCCVWVCAPRGYPVTVRNALFGSATKPYSRFNGNLGEGQLLPTGGINPGLCCSQHGGLCYGCAARARGDGAI